MLSSQNDVTFSSALTSDSHILYKIINDINHPVYRISWTVGSGDFANAIYCD